MSAARVIYALTDPRTGAPRYIGVTEDATTRLCVHVCTARHAVSRGRSSPLYSWILDVLTAGLRPTIQIVRTVDGDKAAGLVAEREEIARFLAAGADLLNRRSTGRQKNPPQHAYRERHRAAGLCLRCSVPAAPGKVHCAAHAADNRERSTLYAAAVDPARTRERGFRGCGSCGVAGHNRRTCPVARAA